jgi:hypothetical protein
LLRHLERVGFTGAPRLVGSGLDADGRELLTFIEGGFTHPGPWSLDGAAAVAQLRAMTDAYGLSAAPAPGVRRPHHRVHGLRNGMGGRRRRRHARTDLAPDGVVGDGQARAAAWLLRNRRTFENALA